MVSNILETYSLKNNMLLEHKRWKVFNRLESLLKRQIFKTTDNFTHDGKLMSQYSTELFHKQPYLEQNKNTSLKYILEFLQKQIYNTSYFGIPTLKSPLDFWVYQEIIFNLRPDVIIEIGNYKGGNVLALAHIMDNIKKGKIIGVDINQKEIPAIVKKHPRVILIQGDACASIDKVKALCKQNKKILIIEDSLHTYQNTLNILRTYSPLVSKGSYFIIEDGICHHGLDVGPNPGPYEAIIDFINENDKFKIDRSKEKFLITWNVKGYLQRIS